MINDENFNPNKQSNYNAINQNDKSNLSFNMINTKLSPDKEKPTSF